MYLEHSYQTLILPPDVCFMDNQIGFILKVVLLSAILSALIKYGGPYLNIPLTAINALLAVFFPTVVMAVLFGWRAVRSHELD